MSKDAIPEGQAPRYVTSSTSNFICMVTRRKWPLHMRAEGEKHRHNQGLNTEIQRQLSRDISREKYVPDVKYMWKSVN